MKVKTLTKSNKVLEDVKISDILKNKDKTLSIMVQEDGTTFKEANNRDEWPNTSQYIFDKAECSDSEGNSVNYKDVLTFNLDTKTTTVKTKQTVYCTLYFVKGIETLTLLQSKTGFQEKSGMYRFVGTSSTIKNNYICFGTIDKAECLGSPDKYMYRIIGLTKEGDTTIGLHANQLKVIKAIPSSTNQQWSSNGKLEDLRWEDTEVWKHLNGISDTQFLYSIRNLKDGIYWDELITSQKWYNVVQSTVDATSEPTSSYTETLSKIGLMYATDYVNAYSKNSNNWLYIKNGWITNSSLGYTIDEWTMTREWFSSDIFGWVTWGIIDGTLDNDPNMNSVHQKRCVRPVFYLKPGILLTGDGTTTDPFRIAG